MVKEFEISWLSSYSNTCIFSFIVFQSLGEVRSFAAPVCLFLFLLLVRDPLHRVHVVYNKNVSRYQNIKGVDLRSGCEKSVCIKNRQQNVTLVTLERNEKFLNHVQHSEKLRFSRQSSLILNILRLFHQ